MDPVKEVIFKNRRMKCTKLLICCELHWGQCRGSQHSEHESESAECAQPPEGNLCQHVPGLSKVMRKRPSTPFKDNHRGQDLGSC